MSLPKIAVTTGDPAGIGPEVCLHLLQNEEIAAQCVPIIFGDKVVLEQAADQCGLPKPQKYIAGLSEADGPCVLDMSAIGLDEFETGTVNAATGLGGFVYVENAINAALGNNGKTVSYIEPVDASLPNSGDLVQLAADFASTDNLPDGELSQRRGVDHVLQTTFNKLDERHPAIGDGFGDHFLPSFRQLVSKGEADLIVNCRHHVHESVLQCISVLFFG